MSNMGDIVLKKEREREREREREYEIKWLGGRNIKNKEKKR